MQTIVWIPSTTPGNAPVTQFRPVLNSIQGQPDAGTLEDVIPDTLVLSDFGDVLQSIRDANGAVDLVVGDDNGVSPVIPAGMLVDLAGLGTIRGLKTQADTGLVKLAIADGAQIVGCAGLSFLELVANPVTAPTVILAPQAKLASVNAHFDPAGAVPTQPILATPDGSTTLLELDGASSLGVTLDNSFHVATPVLSGGTTAGGAGVTIHASSVGRLTLTGTNPIAKSHAAVGAFDYSHDAGALVGAMAAACPALTGLTDSLFSGTLSYKATTLANWSGTAPLTVQNALDRLAASAGPIP